VKLHDRAASLLNFFINWEWVKWYVERYWIYVLTHIISRNIISRPILLWMFVAWSIRVTKGRIRKIIFPRYSTDSWEIIEKNIDLNIYCIQHFQLTRIITQHYLVNNFSENIEKIRYAVTDRILEAYYVRCGTAYDNTTLNFEKKFFTHEVLTT
jgi:hypothetical protein